MSRIELKTANIRIELLEQLVDEFETLDNVAAVVQSLNSRLEEEIHNRGVLEELCDREELDELLEDEEDEGFQVY